MTSLGEDLLQRLLEENAEFKKAYEAHKLYDMAVKKLYKKSHLTTEELEEEMRLKKLKLLEKDKMEAIKSKHGEGRGKEQGFMN